MKRRLLPLILTGLILLSPAAASAQDASLDQRLRDAMRKMEVDLRASQDSQAALQASLDQAQKERDALRQQVAKLSAAAPPAAAPTAPAPQPPAASDAELDDLHRMVASLRREKAALQVSLQRFQAAYQQAAAIARAKDLESRQLAAQLKSSQQVVGVAKDANSKLIALANDILHLYQTQSFRNLLLGSYEPLIGFKRVQLENLVQDYEDKVRSHTYYDPG